MQRVSAATSIVLPYRDAEKTLGECIKSIQEQSLENWELIAVNDNSSDSSEALVQGLAKKDSRIKPIQTIKGGLVSSLNLGIVHSSTPLIARMDADDRMYPNRLRTQVDYMNENPDIGLVSSKVDHLTWAPNETMGYGSYVEWTNQLLTHDEISMNRFIESPFAHPSVLFRKSLLDQYGPYEEGDFPEDYDLWLRLLSCGVKMNKIDQILLEWRDSPGRLSRQCKRYSKDAFQKTKARYFSEWWNAHFVGKKVLTAWGAGKIAKKQAVHLSSYGLMIDRFFDIDPKKIGSPHSSTQVSFIDKIPPPGDTFLLVLAGARSARNAITCFLERKEYLLGKDYMFLA
jgi:glycosyltransferase involved in cell wall biosynthesis